MNVNSNDTIDQLRDVSRELIMGNQDESGAYVASPSFSQYGYSWMRDGAYIAYSMLVSGNRQSTQRYISWVAEVIQRYREKVDRLPDLLASGKPIENNWFYSARYTIAGEEDTSDWPNFQIDGYGSWLWLVAEYLGQCRETLPASWASSAAVVIRYLGIVWKLPNSDCWEEFPEHIHPATLACLAGGLKAISKYVEREEASSCMELSGEITGYLRAHVHPDGFFPKYIGSGTIDASLLWLSVPYNVIPADDPAMRRTIERIENEITIEGGVKRYPQDTYYGGGRWIILSAFLGMYYLRIGEGDRAAEQMAWILEQAEADGHLPEQVLDHVNDPSMIEPWESRWGRVATPLIWSHAMFLILDAELSVYNQKGDKNE